MEEDILRRFIFEEFGMRGEWVKLSGSRQNIRKNQTGNATIQTHLGQTLATVALLSVTIKFNGAFRTLVAQSSHDHRIRGLARSAGEVANSTLEEMFGQGRLVLTIRPHNSDPYQGIVPLKGGQSGRRFADWNLNISWQRKAWSKSAANLATNNTASTGLICKNC